jgi:hypothetical protein
MANKKRIVFILGGFVMLAVCFYAVKQVSAPAHGTEIHTGQKLVATRPKTQTAPKAASTIQNNYFDLRLLPGYREQAASTTVPGLLFQQTIIHPSASGSTVIELAIKSLPEGGINNDSAYRIRQQSANYQLGSLRQGSETIIVAAHRQDSSAVAFWSHGKLMATISVSYGVASDADSSDETKQTIQTLVNNWHWLQ